MKYGYASFKIKNTHSEEYYYLKNNFEKFQNNGICKVIKINNNEYVLYDEIMEYILEHPENIRNDINDMVDYDSCCYIYPSTYLNIIKTKERSLLRSL